MAPDSYSAEQLNGRPHPDQTIRGHGMHASRLCCIGNSDLSRAEQSRAMENVAPPRVVPVLHRHGIRTPA